MPSTSPKLSSHTSAADSTNAVNEFMSKLNHTFKDEIQAIRATILGAGISIREGIKWNAPSFRTTNYFATTNLREKGGISIILHLGAKVREITPEGILIEDPEKLLKWLAKDRAIIVFKDMKDFLQKKAAFERIIQQWITQV